MSAKENSSQPDLDRFQIFKPLAAVPLGNLPTQRKLHTSAKPSRKWGISQNLHSCGQSPMKKWSLVNKKKDYKRLN